MRDKRTKRGTFSRRSLIGGAAALGSVGLAKAAVGAESNPDNLPPNVSEWTPHLGDGVDANPYGMPSPFEEHVIRRNVEWLTASTESSVNFTPLHELEGFVTPNGLCFERHHGGVPEVIPSDYRLMINGLVDRELIFTLDDLKRFPQTNRFYFLECAANGGMEWRGAQLNGCQYTFGMVHNVQYTGVLLKDLAREVGVKADAKWILAEGGDSSGMNRSIPIEKIMDDCMIAWAMNGEALRPEQGYPARLVVPGWEGNMWVKWIRRVEFGDMPYMAREETSKYTDLMEDGNASGDLNATDADGLTDSTYFLISSTPANGSASIDPASGTWLYSANSDFHGSDSFTVSVTDDQNHSATLASVSRSAIRFSTRLRRRSLPSSTSTWRDATTLSSVHLWTTRRRRLSLGFSGRPMSPRCSRLLPP